MYEKNSTKRVRITHERTHTLMNYKQTNDSYSSYFPLNNLIRKKTDKTNEFERVTLKFA